jgi:hypothetical protein
MILKDGSRMLRRLFGILWAKGETVWAIEQSEGGYRMGNTTARNR